VCLLRLLGAAVLQQLFGGVVWNISWLTDRFV
jgi:hypothetical protein